MRVLVLGGNGLIGAALSKRLLDDGVAVTGLARSPRGGAGFSPRAQWISADISTLQKTEDWKPHLSGIDVVVNAAGVLQNGLADNVKAVQTDAISALIDACEDTGVKRFVQISAPGVSENAATEFYRTKAAADARLKKSDLQWTIFKPGLVIAPHAYGGTSLIRMLAAFPVLQPLVLSDVPVQTISIDDVADAVSEAVSGALINEEIDLVESKSRPLADVVVRFRAWLGFSAPLAVVTLPRWFGRFVAVFADIAGWLGWRSALRSTSLSVLSEGVIGDATRWSGLAKYPAKSLEETLEALPSTVQERIYARAMLVLPLALIVLAAFWIVSGVIGFLAFDRAMQALPQTLSDSLARAAVTIGSIADILIGVALLFRPATRLACFASVALSGFYLAASAMLTPHLWSDPLGPMIKVFPAIALAIMIAALLEKR